MAAYTKAKLFQHGGSQAEAALSRPNLSECSTSGKA